ncbi:MAG: twin-arginine translocase subunit TatC [Deltaproteobacteria bacterium]|jgi:sec-independent protein translocase protein TatC|nr:twin-arginine translocase subunit TatC [Deltaproteobacteria bacterium]
MSLKSSPLPSPWSQIDNRPAPGESADGGEPATQADSSVPAPQTDSNSLVAQTDSNAPATQAGGGEPPEPPASIQAQEEPNEKKDENGKEDEEPMGIMDHFRELRGRLLKAFLAVVFGFVVCWILRSYLVDFLFQPLLEALRATNQPGEVVALGVAEKFFTYMKVALVGGIFVGSPLIFYQIWAFIAPGLYDDEKIYMVPVAVCSALFFIAGGAFCYLVMLPNALPFLLGFGEEYMRDTPRMTEYYEFVLQLIFAFGLIFEMPLFVFFLARLGLVSAPMLSKFRRYFVVIAFIMGAVLTPPDVMSQLFMACPMLLLYEFSIIIARIFGRKKKEKTPTAEAPAAS